MHLSLLEILWITIVSMGIVFVMLTILMFLMQGSSKVIQILEAKSHPTAGVVGKPVEVKPEAPQMMEHYLKRINLLELPRWSL